MNKLVSVVIPVYNVAKYLPECLDSVINQTYKNIEVILVDDGSTDESGIICDKYANEDKRITVIHQENQGAGAAKNTGLDLVKGDYLSIIDSDDYIELNMYEKMVSYMENYNVDVVQCLIRNVYVNEAIDRKYQIEQEKNRVVNSKQYMKEFLYDWKSAIFCNKLFRKELLKDHRFEIGRNIDDEFFTYKLICDSKKILKTTDIYYNYRMRKSSVINSSQNERLIKDRLDCFIERFYYVTKKFPSLKRRYNYEMANLIEYFLKNNESIIFATDYKRIFDIDKLSTIDKVYMKLFKIKVISDSLRENNRRKYFE